ncbi:MAG: YqaA family protein [Vicinamibacterales bacterium]
MLAGLLATIQDWATGFGGVGLFVVAALDSSFLSFPQVNDLLIIYLSTKYPALMPYYAGMSTLGSVLGCLALFLVARKGGEVFLRKRFSAGLVDRAVGLYQRFGLLAVMVPALLPPPTPFKLFVLLAGAAGESPWRFVAAIAVGRGVRYFGEGWLAVRYGDHAVDLLRENGATAGLVLAGGVLLAGVIYYVVRTRRAARAGR